MEFAVLFGCYAIAEIEIGRLAARQEGATQ